MSGNPLIVTVNEPETGATWDYVFEAGPVIVGRGDGVQLCLDRPFVSLQHGTFDFDDAGVTYMDLESRNGTLIDGVVRASDRPVPVTETTDLRIGKLRLRVSRVAPVKKVGDEAASPFAPRLGRGPVKGTDALPREELDRVRREIMARKEPPPAVTPPTPPVIPLMPAVTPPTPVVPFPIPPAALPSAPGLEKTVPVPLLVSRPLPEVPLPASPYTPGGTQAVPALARSSGVRRTPRETRPRVAREVRPRRVTPPPRRSGPWLAIAVGVVVAAVAAILLLTMGGGERRREVLEEEPEVTGAGGIPVQNEPVVGRPVEEPKPIVDPPPRVQPAPEQSPTPTVTPRRPQPPPPPPIEKSGNRSPILP